MQDFTSKGLEAAIHGRRSSGLIEILIKHPILLYCYKKFFKRTSRPFEMCGLMLIIWST